MKQFRVVWANTGATLMVVEAYTSNQAVSEAIRDSELTIYDVRAIEIEA